MATESLRQNDFFNICGHCTIECCRDAKPPITQKRKEIIERYIEEKGIPISAPFVSSEYTYPREDESGYCVFYDKSSRRCAIQPVKPETCVAGPFTFDINKEIGVIEWYLKMEKICPLAGVMFRDKMMFEKHFKAARREIFNLLTEIKPHALKAILKREEPDTFKIRDEKLNDATLTKLSQC
ncbi:MAG: YkgJ family cysteine cluster protein [Nitrososphaerales archaeon]